MNLPWHWSVPLMSVAKMGCQLSMLALGSLTMGEDLLSVALCSIGAMLDKAGLMLGNTAGAGASATFLYGAFAIALTLNSASLLSCLQLPSHPFCKLVCTCPPRNTKQLWCCVLHYIHLMCWVSGDFTTRCYKQACGNKAQVWTVRTTHLHIPQANVTCNQCTLVNCMAQVPAHTVFPHE